MIPFDSFPSLPPLFLAFVRGEATSFFPDPPTREAAAARGRDLLARSPEVRVAAGQQAGLFTGPLLALTKAAAAARLASDLQDLGVPARGFFWIATEDHDLAEVARATVMVDGAPRQFRIDDPSHRNYQPTGRVAIPEAVGRIFDAVGDEPAGDAEALSRFRQIWSPGRTFGDAFRETLAFLLLPNSLETVDPLDDRWREAKAEFFGRALELADEIERALSDAEARLRSAGFVPQVQRGDGDFPAFVIEEGTRRKIARDGKNFVVSGHDGRMSAPELMDRVREGRFLPSAAALLRPVLSSFLLPVAASILGPSELAYHAQTVPLFDVFGLPRPVFLPRPHLFPRGARERRAMEALGLDERDLFRARDASRGEPPAISGELRALEEDLARKLDGLQSEVEAVDPTLLPVARAAAEKAVHQISRLREKVEKAAERRNEEKTRRLEIVENLLTPEATPPDRVYTPLTYRCRFGPELASKIFVLAECRLDGARFVEFE